MARPAQKTASESYPKSGNRELFITLDFSNVGTINDDLSPEQRQSAIETFQSIYIDNSLNAASLTIQFNNQQIVFVQPFTQGVYPIIQAGMCSYVAKTAQGIKIPIILSNTAKPYQVWGPVPGVTVTPPLTNATTDIEPLIAGDNILVAGVGGETVKLYRMSMSFGGASILKFYSGASAGGVLLYSAYITVGGSITLNPSGIPWFTTQAGAALIMNSSQAVNAYGAIGYAQS